MITERRIGELLALDDDELGLLDPEDEMLRAHCDEIRAEIRGRDISEHNWEQLEWIVEQHLLPQRGWQPAPRRRALQYAAYLVREAVRDYRAHHDRQRLKNDNLYQAFVRKAIAIVHERCPRITLEAAEVTDLRRWPLPDLSLGVEVFFCDAAEQMRELWPRPRIVRRSR